MECPEYSIGTIETEGLDFPPFLITSGEFSGIAFQVSNMVVEDEDGNLSCDLISIETPNDSQVHLETFTQTAVIPIMNDFLVLIAENGMLEGRE